MSRPRLESAEGVDPAGIDPAPELRTLLRQEARSLAVLLRSRDVELRVGRVEVAHHEDVEPIFAERLDPLEERAVPVELVGHAIVAAILARAVREIAVRDHELAETRDLESALVVEMRGAEGCLDGVGLSAREQTDARIALFRRGDVVLMVVVEVGELGGNRGEVGADFL